MSVAPSKPLLVVGAGVAGVTAALEAAEAGVDVVLVERESTVGGRVLRHHQYFPKFCPPSCGIEINTRRLERTPRVRVITHGTVTAAARHNGAWQVRVLHQAEHVTSACTACGECTKVCPAKIADPFNFGQNQVAAVRLPHPDAWPRRFVLDRAACPPGCARCAEVCPVRAIQLDAQPREEVLEVGAVIVATGWRPYAAERLTELGGGTPDVIASVQLERLAATSGPTAGQILRPSDGRAPRRVAFVQCAGSRDVRHLPYCSGVCCLASLKQALYVRAQIADAEVTFYYIDRRTPGRSEVLLRQAAEAGVRLVKGKVSSVDRKNDGTLLLKVEDVDAERLLEAEADLVVLATGMVPESTAPGLPFPLTRDDDGFALDDEKARLFIAGVARRPVDVAATVRDATGAAAKAIAATRSV